MFSPLFNWLTRPYRAWFIHRKFGVAYGYAKEVLALMDQSRELSEQAFDEWAQGIQARYPEDAAHGRVLDW